MIYFFRLFSIILIVSGISTLLFSHFIGRCQTVQAYESIYGRINKKNLSLYQGSLDLISGIILLILTLYNGTLALLLTGILLAIVFTSTPILSRVVKPKV